MDKPIGLVAALAAEAKAMLGPGTWDESGPYPMRDKTYGNGQTVRCVLSGVGGENALPAARYLVHEGAGMLISAGVSGGLHPAMKPGELVVSHAALDADGMGAKLVLEGSEKNARAILERMRAKGIPARLGHTLACARPALTASDKSALHQNTNALAVDMESAAVARAAKEGDIPFLAVRAVCDSAGRDVSQDLFSCMKDNGKPDLWQVVKVLVSRPSSLGDFMRMGKEYSRALDSLKQGWRSTVDVLGI